MNSNQFLKTMLKFYMRVRLAGYQGLGSICWLCKGHEEAFGEQGHQTRHQFCVPYSIISQPVHACKRRYF